MKNILFITLFLVSFNYSNAQKGTTGTYTQGKDYKACTLIGYGTDREGGYDNPRMVFNKFDSGSSNFYLWDIFPFTNYGSMKVANEEGADSVDENLEIFFIFVDDKKNKKWELSRYSFGMEDEEYDYSYDALFIYELKNVTSGETLNRNKIIEKLLDSKEVVITLTDDLTDRGEDNVCRFQIKKHSNKIEKVFSDKHFSKDQELLN